MTTITPLPATSELARSVALQTPARRPARRSLARGFTLVEVMVGATIGAFVLAGVLSCFLLIIRSGINVANYSDMERDSRRGLEYFAEDSRQASSITWNSATSITLVVNGGSIVYSYNSGTQKFNRNNGTSTDLLSGVDSFTFKGYSITGAEVDISDLSTAAKRTTASTLTKQLQISLRAKRTTQTVAAATNTVLSARFILRNKPVTS
jgi:prepilin-type N-terminal cleavage/methylation domain-containing protein